MTRAEFRAALRLLGMTVKQFADDLGKDEAKVIAWWKGEDAVPHDIGLILALLELPGGVERLRAYADYMLERGQLETRLADAKRLGSE